MSFNLYRPDGSMRIPTALQLQKRYAEVAANPGSWAWQMRLRQVKDRMPGAHAMRRAYLYDDLNLLAAEVRDG